MRRAVAPHRLGLSHVQHELDVAVEGGAVEVGQVLSGEYEALDALLQRVRQNLANVTDEAIKK